LPGRIFLHHAHDTLDVCHVVAVAREDFVEERQPLGRAEQTDADPLAIGPRVAGVAALGLLVGVRPALEERAFRAPAQFRDKNAGIVQTEITKNHPTPSAA